MGATRGAFLRDDEQIRGIAKRLLLNKQSTSYAVRYIVSPWGEDMRKHEQFRNCSILRSEKFGDFRERTKLETLIKYKMSALRQQPAELHKFKAIQQNIQILKRIPSIEILHQTPEKQNLTGCIFDKIKNFMFKQVGNGEFGRHFFGNWPKCVNFAPSKNTLAPGQLPES